MPTKTPIFRVPKPDEDTVLQEIKLRAELERRKVAKTFDADLGSNWEEAEARIMEMRRDINKYGEYVFGFAPADIHRLWNKVAEDVIYHRVPQNKVLFIAPPNSAKSTWNSIIRPVHYLGNHPDHSLVFMTSSDPMAQTFGSTVKTALAENERHRIVFDTPACRPHFRRGWSTDGLYLRGTLPGSKDPAYKAVGFGASVMGARAHGIIIDDPLDQKQAVSEAEQRRAKAYYDATLAPRLRIDGGWMLAVMTRFHENDFASHLIRLSEEAGDWIVIRTPLIAIEGFEDPLGRMPGQVLWPEQFTPEWLEREQLRMTIAQFNLVHQGDPTGIGGDIFETEEWFRDLPPNFWSEMLDDCAIVQAWDLAWGSRERACYTVGMTAAVDERYNIYILNVLRRRFSSAELELEIAKLARDLNPIIVAIESDNFHKQSTAALAQHIRERVMTNVQLIRPDRDKVARARLPASRAQHGMVFVDKKSPWYRTFMSEVLGFPNTRYNDQVDCFSLLALVVQHLSDWQHSRQVRPVQTIVSA